MSLEEIFQSWSEGPSKTEESKCENTENVIRETLNNDETLSKMDISVLTQGSYKARTNVKLDSDVDICILLNSQFFYDLPATVNLQSTGITDATLTYQQFKNLVEIALINRFGKNNVTRGNKAFDIHENTYRVDADVVPAFGHRRYTGKFNSDGSHAYLSGVELRPDNSGKIINWPDQTHENGVYKNSLTSRKYKRAIRILKRLRNAMQEDKIKEAEDIGSFLIESLVWNVPNSAFTHEKYEDIMRDVLAHTFNNTLAQEKCDEWGEVNELKYLFKGGQPWTREQSHKFLSAAWDYIGYK